MRRSLFVACALVLFGLGSIAEAVPPKKAPKPDYGLKKKSKKELQVEKHEVLAQYYLRSANDTKGAIKEYQAIMRLDGKNVRAGLALASLYQRDKNQKEAIKVLTALGKKSPKNDEVWLALAEIQAEAKDDKGMKASIDKALAIDSSNASAYWLLFERAQARVEGGDQTAKAELVTAARKFMSLTRRQSYTYKIAERAVVQHSGEPLDLTVYDAKIAFAAAFEGAYIGDINRKMADARRGFEKCTKEAPKNEDCHLHLGLVYSSVKSSESYDQKKALAEFALAPSMAKAWIETGRIYRANDKNAEARAALEKALQVDKESAVAHIELGILDKVAGKTEAAATHFIAAMDADPFGADGERGLDELTKVKPTHPRVTQGLLEGKRAGDIFSTDRYKAAVSLIEQQLGGVEKDAPEQLILEKIVQKLADGSGLKTSLKVQLVATKQVNAFALSDGNMYVTRGLLEMLEKKTGKKVDEKNDVLGHILGHEVAHVTRRHIVSSSVFQEAMKDASRPLDPSVMTHVTRLHEIDADREGMVMAFLAGFHPRGGIEFMEVMGKEMEIPTHLDHPTFEERVSYLTDYWTNDVRYAFVSFKLGVAAMDKGAKLESSDMTGAVAAYNEAVEAFKKFKGTLPNQKEASNDLGVAYTKLGVLAMSADTAAPLGRWQTRFSLERDSAVKYVGLARDGAETKGGQRGTELKQRIPWQLREAISTYKEALAIDETYSRARLNLAAAYVAANQMDNAKTALAKVELKGGVTAGDVELINGIIHAESKAYDKAKASFEKALSSQQGRRAAAYNIAKNYELAGKKPEAKKAYQEYAKQYPGTAWSKAAEAAAAKL